jgi:mannosyl-oligosaccharide alpha-1,2-mannosidase
MPRFLSFTITQHSQMTIWETAQAKAVISDSILYLGDLVGALQVFESTIRILGGLLSAFHHSGGDELFLRHAVEFAER